MAFKRNIARLPISPADATVHNVVCQFCIVGCGYHAYSWPVNKQGGTAPDQNISGVDLSQQQEAGTATVLPFVERKKTTRDLSQSEINEAILDFILYNKTAKADAIKEKLK